MSRWLLGSSSSITSGADSSSLASISRLCWPPLNVSTGRSIILAAEAEAVQHLFDAVVDVEGVVVAEQFVEAIVARCQAFALRFIGRFGQRLGGADHVVVGGEQFVERGLGLGEQGAAGGEVRLLAQQGHARAGVQADVAVVGLVEAGQQAQQRGLAGAVGADQADALAGVQLEADVLEQRPLVEAARQAGTAQ